MFQNYNLIPHQNVLTNVELALTLSGVSKQERRTKAIAALEKVGLGDQIRKKPNQLSGGQAQRVAIARALVNDPDIILADEPTGALDTETSIQVLNILKEISKEKLVIMVTHNSALAEQYSTRIVKLLDGNLIGDEQRAGAPRVKKENLPEGHKIRKTYMSFFTALSLSLKNLMTKKGRTVLTSFAGSIGIIGIALILALSNGIQLYINRVQEDTLSSYPFAIEREAADVMGFMKLRSSGEGRKVHSLMRFIQHHGIKLLNSMYTVKEQPEFHEVYQGESRGLPFPVQYSDLNLTFTPCNRQGGGKLLKLTCTKCIASADHKPNPMMSQSYGQMSVYEMLDDKAPVEIANKSLPTPPQP